MIKKKVIQKEIIRDHVDRKQRICKKSDTAWVNSSQRKVGNGLFGEFTKKTEMEQTVAFQLTSKSSFIMDLSALEATVLQRLL